MHTCNLPAELDSVDGVCISLDSSRIRDSDIFNRTIGMRCVLMVEKDYEMDMPALHWSKNDLPRF
jgi:hypothetical protein